MNCIVLGSGRSGTSMINLLLANAGFYFGSRHIGYDEGNPLGYYEDRNVNNANDVLLWPYFRAGPARVWRRITRKPHLESWQGWLLDITPEQAEALSVPNSLRESFVEFFKRQPFAYKDPRFSFTLPAILPLLPSKTVFICVYRDPRQVVVSTIKEARKETKHRDWQDRYPINYCYRMWEAHYRCIINAYTKFQLSCVFVRYERLISGRCVSKISDLVGAKLDGSLIKPELNRIEPSAVPMPASTSALLAQLDELSA